MSQRPQLVTVAAAMLFAGAGILGFSVALVVLGVLAIGLAALALYTVQTYCSTHDCTL